MLVCIASDLFVFAYQMFARNSAYVDSLSAGGGVGDGWAAWFPLRMRTSSILCIYMVMGCVFFDTWRDDSPCVHCSLSSQCMVISNSC